jgi:Ricin-type beta-trefoil lectin domain
MPDRLQRTLAAVIAAAAALLVTAAPIRAETSAAPVGPAPVSPLGHRGLCWQAWGNGSTITLQRCAAGQDGQLWTFTGNGVLMNGNGYCLQAGPAGSLFLTFRGQCAGAPGQRWTFSGATSQIRNTPTGDCAYVEGGAVVPGAQIAARRCVPAANGRGWSQGISDLTLSTPRQGSPATSGVATSAVRAFTARVTVSNAPRAATAYAAAVWFRLPRGLTVSRLAATGGLRGWTCTLTALSCHGNLGPGATGQVTVGGKVAGGYPAAGLAAHADARHTNQHGRPVRAATVPVRVHELTAAGPPAAHGPLTSGVAVSGLAVAGLLVTLGGILAFVTRRRQWAPAHTSVRPATAPSPPPDR